MGEDDIATRTACLPELVTVLVPAHNAAATVDATLASVRAQTHAALDIIVIDDGSTDATAAIVQAHAARDRRIRLLRQANRGVAAARNLGLAHARGRFVAPIDADDLWRADKIERQLARMLAGGDRAGLVYCWYAMIDPAGRITAHESRNGGEGNVIAEMCLRNLVGNGSSALMRRDAIIAAGGYDETLRRRGAEGCEDYLLYFRIAERHDFLLVADYLTGYRLSPDNMSSNVRTMLRSRDLCIATLADRHPDRRAQFHRGRTRMMRFLFSRSLRAGRWRTAGWMLREMVRHDPPGAVANLIALLLRLPGRGWRRLTAGAPQPFPIGLTDDLARPRDANLPDRAEGRLNAVRAAPAS